MDPVDINSAISLPPQNAARGDSAKLAHRASADYTVTTHPFGTSLSKGKSPTSRENSSSVGAIKRKYHRFAWKQPVYKERASREERRRDHRGREGIMEPGSVSLLSSDEEASHHSYFDYTASI